MTRVVIGVAEQTLAYDLRSALEGIDGHDVSSVVETTGELVEVVLQEDPDVVLVHDELGPESALDVIRDLSLRRPTCAALTVTLEPSTEGMAAAMAAGARGTLSYPLTSPDLQSRLLSAGDWSQQMRRLLSAIGPSADGAPGSRARVVTFVGAKGGVGTTTIACHMALDVVRTVLGHQVCVVDLDLEKGDVSGLLEVRHRASVADVAKVAEDLSARAVGDAVVAHESGLHLLLAPTDVRDVEAVDPRALREIVAVLRREYDLVVIDAGSHVTPAQAGAVELADEVVAVTTPDVLAMRSLRRSISMWEALGVRKEPDLRVLVNRVSRQTTMSADTVRQLTRAPVLSTGLPAMFRGLEPGLNTRDPFAVREEVWWRSLRALGNEIGLVRTGVTRQGQAAAELGARRGRGRRRRGPRGDGGAVALETAGIVPLALLVALVMWQFALYGMSMVWSGQAANAAARALSVHDAPGPAARASVPSGVAGGLQVTPEGAGTGTDTVTVSLRVPLVSPGIGSLPTRVTVRRTVEREP